MRTNGLGIRLSLAAFLALSPMAAQASPPGDCVRTVRSLSNFTIRGDAWLWWTRSEGQYARDDDPAVGSVLVFKRAGRLSRGHVSLVSRVIDSRTIEVDHTWLDGEGLQRNMRVIDVSARGDWSRVRVWHDPSDSWGLRTYPTYGFILPDGVAPQDGSPKLQYAVAPAGRGAKAAPDSLRVADLATTVPARKPLFQTVSLTLPATTPQAATPQAAMRATVMAPLPTPKPKLLQSAEATATPAKVPASRVESAKAEFKVAVLPGRKPAHHDAAPQVASSER